jgi:hypothetical protein
VNILLEGYQSEKLISKGFHASAVIQDFPIRESALFLHVRRRKRQVESSGDIISGEWDITSRGARYTKGFSAFLKELLGQLPGEQQKPLETLLYQWRSVWAAVQGPFKRLSLLGSKRPCIGMAVVPRQYRPQSKH